MPEFVFSGRLVLDGADFIIEAGDLQEAINAALAGKWDNWETDHSETIVESKIYPETGRRRS